MFMSAKWTCSARSPLSKLLCVASTLILQCAGGVIEHMNEIEAIDFALVSHFLHVLIQQNRYENTITLLNYTFVLLFAQLHLIFQIFSVTCFV